MTKNSVFALSVLGAPLALAAPFALASSAQKGVIYLPVVSLGSYLPIAGQILLMILVISLSGMFGAWLMFQRLAKKVLALETDRPPTPVVERMVTAAAQPEVAQAIDAVEPEPAAVVQAVAAQAEPAAEPEQVTQAGGRAPLLGTVRAEEAVTPHRRTLFVSKKPVAPTKVPKNSAARLVVGRPVRAKVIGPAARDDNRVVPQTFLINDWFPLDH